MPVFDNTATTTTNPIDWLQPYTQHGVEYINNLLNQGPFQGPYAAPINAMQTGGIQQGSAAAGGAGNVANAYNTAGNQLLPGIGQAFNFYSNAAGGQSMNPWLTNTDRYLGLAGNIANNPYMDQMINASLRDPFRQLMEQTRPGITTGFNAGGAAGGSQEAIRRAIADRGFADRAADVSAGMRGTAYSQGLGYANQAAGADYNLMQNSANQLFNMGQAGLGMLEQGYGMAQKGATDLFNWGGQQAALENDQIKARMAEYMAPWELAQSYGSYVNPLSTQLTKDVTKDNMMAAWLFQGLGPILGGIGSDIGGEAWDWIKGWDIWNQIGLGGDQQQQPSP